MLELQILISTITKKYIVESMDKNASMDRNSQDHRNSHHYLRQIRTTGTQSTQLNHTSINCSCCQACVYWSLQQLIQYMRGVHERLNHCSTYTPRGWRLHSQLPMWNVAAKCCEIYAVNCFVQLDRIGFINQT